MGMRETPRSMRIYLVLAGVLGIYTSWAPTMRSDGAIQILAALGMLVSVGFVYCGARFTQLLSSGADQVAYELYAALLQSVGLCLVVYLALKGHEGVDAKSLLFEMYIRTAIAIAIVLYLLANLKRLRRDGGTGEAAAGAQGEDAE